MRGGGINAGRLQARCPGGVAAFELMWKDFLDHALDWTGPPRPFDQDHPLLALTDLSGSEQPALAHALEEVLGPLPAHFERYDFENRYIAAHVVKKVRAKAEDAAEDRVLDVRSW